MSVLVEVRPIDRKKWHGKTGKESFGRPITVEALYSEKTGKLRTGLTEKEAEEYGKRLGVDLSDRFIADQPHPFWSTKAAWVPLQNNTMIFNIEKPMDFVKVKLLKDSEDVANSMAELEAGKWPEATHVIFDEQEDIDLKASKIAIINKANKIADAMSHEQKAAIVMILSDRTVKVMSPNFVITEIDEIIKEKADEFMRIARMDKTEITIRANVLEMLKLNILTKEGEGVYYMGTQLGYNYEEAVKYFQDPNNQQMKVALMEQLHKKTI